MQSHSTVDELAAHVAHAALPEAWLDLAHGRITADEAVAATRDHEPTKLVERSRALFSPPSAQDERERLDVLLSTHFSERSRTGGLRRWPFAVIALLAACVLLALPLLRESATAFDGGYALSLAREYEGVRDASPTASQDVPVYVEGRKIELRLQPLETVSQDVGIKVFASSEGRTIELSVSPRINASGVIEIIQTTSDLGLSAGSWLLTAVVGPPQHLPATVSAVRADDADAPYDVVSTTIEVVSIDDLPEP